MWPFRKINIKDYIDPEPLWQYSTGPSKSVLEEVYDKGMKAGRESAQRINSFKRKIEKIQNCFDCMHASWYGDVIGGTAFNCNNQKSDRYNKIHRGEACAFKELL